jgi:hypothetical protein
MNPKLFQLANSKIHEGNYFGSRHRDPLAQHRESGGAAARSCHIAQTGGFD